MYSNDLKYRLLKDKEKPISDVLIRVNQLKSKYSHLVFVEGKTDITFYENTKVLQDVDNYTIITTPSQNCYDVDYKGNVITGKKYVINSYKRLKENAQLSKRMNDYVFIVDHDFDGLDSYYDTKLQKIVFLTDLDKRNISCTAYYAIESYCLLKDNLKLIFDFFDITFDFEKFYNEFLEFVKETKEFFALIATMHYAVSNNIKLSKIFIKIDDLFNSFDFIKGFVNINKKYSYDKEKLVKACKERIEAINKSRDRKKLYKIKEKYEKFILENNFIQGHTAYNFLRDYLYQYHNVDIKQNPNKKDYMSMLDIIKVEIDLRYGNGKKINN